MKLREQYTCPLEIVHDIVKGKWKTLIIFHLQNGGLSLSKLEKETKGISQKMLLQQLKELREFGLIDKHTYEGYPLKVEYFLTKRGKEILKAVLIMQQVGSEMIKSGE